MSSCHNLIPIFPVPLSLLGKVVSYTILSHITTSLISLIQDSSAIGSLWISPLQSPSTRHYTPKQSIPNHIVPITHEDIEARSCYVFQVRQGQIQDTNCSCSKGHAFSSTHAFI